MLTDAQWAMLEPLVEQCRPKGKPHRTICVARLRFTAAVSAASARYTSAESKCASAESYICVVVSGDPYVALALAAKADPQKQDPRTLVEESILYFSQPPPIKGRPLLTATHLALHDPLTELPNRRFFMELAQKTIQQSHRTTFETPSSPMDTPYNTSAASMVRRRWVTTMNCARSA